MAINNVSRAQRYEGFANPTAKQAEARPAEKAGDFVQTIAQGFGTAAQVALPLAQQMLPMLAGSTPIGALASTALGGGVGGSDQSSMALLQLQRQINQEALYYQTVSNIDKTRHDSAMNSARNIKQ